MVSASDCMRFFACSFAVLSAFLTVSGTFGDDWVHVDTQFGFGLTVAMVPSRCTDMPEDEQVEWPGVDVPQQCDLLRKAVASVLPVSPLALLLPAIALQIAAVILLIVAFVRLSLQKVLLPLSASALLAAGVLSIYDAAHSIHLLHNNHSLVEQFQLKSIGLGWCLDIVLVGGMCSIFALPPMLMSIVLSLRSSTEVEKKPLP